MSFLGSSASRFLDTFDIVPGVAKSATDFLGNTRFPKELEKIASEYEALRSQGLAQDKKRYEQALAQLSALQGRQSAAVDAYGKKAIGTMKNQFRTDTAKMRQSARARGLGTAGVGQAIKINQGKRYASARGMLEDNISRLRMSTDAQNTTGITGTILNRSEPIPGLDLITNLRQGAYAQPNPYAQFLMGLVGQGGGIAAGFAANR